MATHCALDAFGPRTTASVPSCTVYTRFKTVMSQVPEVRAECPSRRTPLNQDEEREAERGYADDPALARSSSEVVSVALGVPTTLALWR